MYLQKQNRPPCPTVATAAAAASSSTKVAATNYSTRNPGSNCQAAVAQRLCRRGMLACCLCLSAIYPQLVNWVGTVKWKPDAQTTGQIIDRELVIESGVPKCLPAALLKNRLTVNGNPYATGMSGVLHLDRALRRRQDSPGSTCPHIFISGSALALARPTGCPLDAVPTGAINVERLFYSPTRRPPAQRKACP